MDQLTEDFLFVPDVGDMELFPEVYQLPAGGYDPDRDTLWTPDQERRFVINLLDRERFQKISFRRWYKSLLDERIISEDGLRETYIFNYEVEFTEQPREEEEEVSIIAVKGRMEVDLSTPTTENPVWLIQRWQDFRDPASAKRSWTELRGLFAQ
jgi:hypothetical protein